MKCEECKFWEETGLVDEEDTESNTEGFCCKYAPRIVRGMLFQAPDMSGTIDWRRQEFPDCWEGQEAIWPKTLSFQGCGEFQEKDNA